MTLTSTSPEGVSFALPTESDVEQEKRRLSQLICDQKKSGKQIVTVQGLGFVGAVNAAVIADAESSSVSCPFFVVGVDLPSEDHFWKIQMINQGKSPYQAEDDEIPKIFRRTALDKKSLTATWLPDVYEQADIILVNINLDVVKHEIGNALNSDVLIKSFEKAINVFAERMPPSALVLVESTVPPGTVENIVQPIIERAFEARGIDKTQHQLLLAHSAERVMPGKDYVRSIRKMWRSYAGINQSSATRAKDFLSTITDTENYPLWNLGRPNASELAKVMENSYRAMNIAFIHEWTLLAEDLGINLFDVVRSIRVRKGTHDNMMLPGFGVGGYCLTKDPLLAQWTSKTLLKREDDLTFSVNAVNVNDLMPLHTFALLKKGLDNDISQRKIAILGASYRQDVDDTRNSPTISLYDEVVKKNGIPVVHDPFAKLMSQRDEIRIYDDLKEVLQGADAVVLVVNHAAYLKAPVSELSDPVQPTACFIDAFDILSDDKIRALIERGHRVLGVGKGHIEGLKRYERKGRE